MHRSLCSSHVIVEESEAGPSRVDALCQLCEDTKANLEFGPCGHTIMCSSCGSRVKKCLECQQIVETRKIIHNDPQARRPSSLEYYGGRFRPSVFSANDIFCLKFLKIFENFQKFQTKNLIC
eukprot:sb/3475910/